MRSLSVTTWICLAGLVAVFTAAVLGDRLLPEITVENSAADPDAISDASALVRLPLPDAPERRLVETYCQNCHQASRIEKAGGSLEGWTSRIRRMVRSGSQIPPDQIPVLAAYLAKALPERAHAGDQAGGE